MKVIFLDIDGVLNSEEFAIWCRDFPDFIKNGGSNWVDPNAVKMIEDICKDYDVKLVISSSWRTWDLESTIEEFNRYKSLCKLTPYIVGITPRNTDYYVREDRGEEIQHYLDTHPEIENYCIIDDDNDMLDSQRDNFVRTNSIHGLTIYDCDKIREIFNRGKSNFRSRKIFDLTSSNS